MVRVVGATLFGDRLRRLEGPVLRHNVAQAVERGVGRIAKRAKDSIIEGAVSGSGHVPSRPGEPPHADTHELDESITSRLVLDTGSIRGEVVASASYAAPLEFGTDSIEERPYLRPAAQAERPAARRDIRDAVNKTNRGA